MESGQSKSVNSILLIRTLLPSLHSSLQKVGRYIVANEKSVVNQSIDELSVNCGVSKASVVRFCKALGFSGYRDFRLQFIQDLTRESVGDKQYISQKEHLSSAFSDQVEAVRNTWELLDAGEFYRAVDAMVSARQIIWFGVGASGYLAQWVNHKAGLIGANTRGVDSPDLFTALTRQLSEEDVVVCFSHSGSTPSIVEPVRKARTTGACFIVITNHAASPLAKLADVKLITADHQFRLGDQVVSFRPAHEAVANALLSQMVRRRECTG